MSVKRLWGAITLALIGLLLLGAGVRAHPDIDTTIPPRAFPHGVHLESQLGGPVRALAKQGNILYAVTGPYLKLVDVSNPDDPHVVGSFPAWGRFSDVVVTGTFAYLTDRVAGLVVLDVTDPTDPFPIAVALGPGSSLDYRRIVVAGGCAYVTDPTSYLRIFDVTDPYHPTYLSSFRPSGTAWYIQDLALSGTLAYVGYSSRMAVVDVTTPTAPEMRAMYQASSAMNMTDLVLAGPYAYVAASSRGMILFDVTGGLTPTLVSETDTPSATVALVVSGTMVYAADSAGGVRAIDAANPLMPTEVASFDTPGSARDLIVEGSTAYVADDARGLRVLEMGSIPFTETSALDLPSASWSVSISDTLAYVGDYYYMAGASEGLGAFRVVDVSQPASPTQIGLLPTKERVLAIARQGRYAYLANDRDGLRIVDISDPGHPQPVGRYPTFKLATDVALAGPVAYVTTGSGGLHLVDVSEPITPTEVGTWSLSNVSAVAVRLPYAYVAGQEGMHVVDVTDPATPTTVATYTVGYGSDVALAGDYAYLGAGDDGLHILDVSDPASPTLAAVVLMEARYVAVEGTRAYISGGDPEARLVVLDIADPARPRTLACYPATSELKEVTVAPDAAGDPLAFVAGGSQGLLVLRVRFDVYLPLVTRSF